jgi:hypothetical protein
MDGYRLIQIYRKLGLELESARNLIESGNRRGPATDERRTVEGLRFADALLEELRYYHRGERGQIVTGSDHLQNATRSLVVSGMRRMRTKPVKKPSEHCYGGGDPLGWITLNRHLRADAHRLKTNRIKCD